MHLAPKYSIKMQYISGCDHLMNNPFTSNLASEWNSQMQAGAEDLLLSNTSPTALFHHTLLCSGPFPSLFLTASPPEPPALHILHCTLLLSHRMINCTPAQWWAWLWCADLMILTDPSNSGYSMTLWFYFTAFVPCCCMWIYVSLWFSAPRSWKDKNAVKQ